MIIKFQMDQDKGGFPSASKMSPSSTTIVLWNLRFGPFHIWPFLNNYSKKFRPRITYESRQFLPSNETNLSQKWKMIVYILIIRNFGASIFFWVWFFLNIQNESAKMQQQFFGPPPLPGRLSNVEIQLWGARWSMSPFCKLDTRATKFCQIQRKQNLTQYAPLFYPYNI